MGVTSLRAKGLCYTPLHEWEFVKALQLKGIYGQCDSSTSRRGPCIGGG